MARTIKDARRMALHRGASVEFEDGTVLNPGGRRAPLAPASVGDPDYFEPPQPQAEPPPPPPPSLLMEDVQRLLDARDVVWRAELDRVASRGGEKIRHWRFDVTYTNDGKVSEINATAA